jgi:hypothetical protein
MACPSLAAEREQAKTDATETVQSMQRALESRHRQHHQLQQPQSHEQQGRRVRPFASDAAAGVGTPASEAATIVDMISTPVTIGDAINTATPVGSTEDLGLAPSPLSLLGRMPTLPPASQVSTAKSTAPARPTSNVDSDRLFAAEREIHALRRQMAAAGARAEEAGTDR